MTNILDYLDWRGDISMQTDAFGTVDALILAELSYLPMEELIPSEFGIGKSIAELAEEFDPEQIKDTDKIYTFAEDVTLLHKLAESERFRTVRLMGCSSITDAAQNVQFAAFTCILPTEEYYIAFRGTDGSLAGWKEDFEMSYQDETAGQHCAVDYLNKHDGASHNLIVGGHSKGGNLAVYAATSCLPRVQKLIRKVYDFDGPGFRDEFADSQAYLDTIPKIVSVIPQSSLVGQLLTSHTDHQIVRSNAAGIMQHFVYSWEVMRNHLVYTEELSAFGVFINKTVRSWLSSIDDDSRRALTEAIFDVMAAPEAETIGEMGQNKLKSLRAILAAVKTLEPEQQALVRQAVAKLAVSGGAVIRAKIKTVHPPALPVRVRKLLPNKKEKNSGEA